MTPLKMIPVLLLALAASDGRAGAEIGYAECTVSLYDAVSGEVLKPFIYASVTEDYRECCMKAWRQCFQVQKRSMGKRWPYDRGPEVGENLSCSAYTDDRIECAESRQKLWKDRWNPGQVYSYSHCAHGHLDNPVKDWARRGALHGAISVCEYNRRSILESLEGEARIEYEKSSYCEAAR